MALSAPENSGATPSKASPEKFFPGWDFKQYLQAIFLLALAFRLAVIFALHNFKNVFGNENEIMALNMIAGKGMSLAFIIHEMPSAITGPLYTVFLYLHFLVFGKNYMFVELTQAVIGSGSAVVLALVARRIVAERVAIIAGILCAIYPTYVYWCALPMQLTVDVFLLEVALLLAMIAMERDKFGWHILAGVWIGLTALSKSFYISFPVFYLLWLWVWKKPGLKKNIQAALVWALFAAVTIAPMAIRNYHVFHRWVPLTTNGGVNFWYGNNPRATGSLYTKQGRPMLDYVPRALMPEIAQAKTEAEKEALLKEVAMAWVKRHPREFVRLIPLRIRAIWWFDPEMSTSFPLARKAVYILLLVFTIPGIILSFKSWRGFSIFYFLPLWQTLFYSAFVGQARFRYLIEFEFLIFSAFFLVWLWQKNSAYKKSSA
jgi:4-amino-4-deoxy-L-arabinose transferase-like glycosyltransferase